MKTNYKFANVRFNFPKDPMNIDFMKIWEVTIERDDFEKLKKKIKEKEKRNGKR